MKEDTGFEHENFPMDPVAPVVKPENFVKEVIVFGLISVITLAAVIFSVYIAAVKFF